jgi:hypothetical protein
MGVAHMACTAVDQRVQQAGVVQVDGSPCFAVAFAPATGIELGGIEVNERLDRGVRPIWQLTFPDSKIGGAHLASSKCLMYGAQLGVLKNCLRL